MPKRAPSIDYTSRDFTSIKNDLVEYAKRYYPDTFKDFSQPSFGALMLDTVAYVGDILSFYLDYQANESFLSTAIEYDNIIKLASQMGYKWDPNPSSYGTVMCYTLVPVETNTIAPDTNYMPVMKKGSSFISSAGNRFTLIEDLDFSKTTNEVVVAQTDASTGAPTSYAVKAAGQVVSGELSVQEITVGAYEKFLRLKLSAKNISEVISVTDANGNRYYEVDYLSQNVIYSSIVNKNSDKNVVSNILKPITVARRYTVEHTQEGAFLQFGYGSEESPVEMVAPNSVVLDLHGKDYTTDKSFDPSVLNETDKLGVVPSSTVLTVVYRVNTLSNVNAAAGTINRVGRAELQFTNSENLSAAKMNFVRNGLSVLNEEAIVGDVLQPSSTEVKQRALGAFATQNRAVTRQDYVSMVYRMPTKYGAIKYASILQDTDSFNQRNLNLYVLSEDASGLTTSSATLKNNLKTWINQYKMMNDTIEILDAKIVNLEINFVAKAFPDANKNSALAGCQALLRTYFARKNYEIGEPFVITDVYSVLKRATGVMDAISVDVTSKTGTGYPGIDFDIFGAKTPNGLMIIPPPDVVFEIRFPGKDITGTIT